MVPQVLLSNGYSSDRALTQDPACIFCRIVAGLVPAKVVLEDNSAMVILDAFPLATGHSLVIPKKHYSRVQDMSQQDSSAVFELLRRVCAAVESGSQSDASTIAVHNGKRAGQEIPHVHIHIVPRKPGDGAGPIHSMFSRRPVLSHEDMESVFQKIKNALSS